MPGFTKMTPPRLPAHRLIEHKLESVSVSLWSESQQVEQLNKKIIDLTLGLR